MEEKVCYNCGYPLPSSAKFCSNCGQRYTDGKVSIKNILADFFKNVLSLDHKLINTAGAFFIPGKLPQLYFQGKQKSYLSPIKLFLSVGLFTVFVFSLLTLDKESFSDMGDMEKEYISKYSQREVLQSLDSLTTSPLVARSSNCSTILATIADTLHHKYSSDSTKLDDSINISFLLPTTNLDEPKDKSLSIAVKDIIYLEDKEITKKYFQDEVWWRKLIYLQTIKSTKEGENLARFVIENSIFEFFILIPIFAFVLKLLYIRRKHYYVEHLVFTFHYHCFWLFTLSVFWIIDHIWSINSLLYSLGISFVYLLFAVKFYYKQSWLKTVFKVLIASLFYLLFFILTTTLSLILGFILF